MKSDATKPATVEIGQWWQFGNEPVARRVNAIADGKARLVVGGIRPETTPAGRVAQLELVRNGEQWRFLGWTPLSVEREQIWSDGCYQYVVSDISDDGVVTFNGRGATLSVSKLMGPPHNMMFGGYTDNRAIVPEMFGVAPMSDEPDGPVVAPAPRALRGWICPRCGAGCGPFVARCPCYMSPRLVTQPDTRTKP